MKKKIIDNIGPILAIILFTLAMRTILHLLREYRFRDIVTMIKSIPAPDIALAVLLTFISYLMLTSYDALALRYLKQRLSYSKVVLASFISYTFSNTIGLTFITGGSVRYRLYSGWGLSALDVTKIVTFCSATLWLGFFAVAGIVFSVEHIVIPPSLKIPLGSARVLGILFLIAVIAYLCLVIFARKTFKIRDWEFSLPSVKIAVSQIAMASLDWLAAAGALYVLMPHSLHLSFPEFLEIFLLAQVAGAASQVPGGLGIFESVILILLSPELPASSLIGSLLAFRAIYYLLPLLLGALLLGAEEVLSRKADVKRIALSFGQWIPLIAPHFLAATTFICGAILLFSGSLPLDRPHLRPFLELLPLPVIEISHFLGSLIGMALLILAWGLQRRLYHAYILTMGMLGAGIIISLLKGLRYEEAIILAIMLVVLAPSRQHFYRKDARLSQRFTPMWFASVAIVIICSFWLGVFCYKHVQYTDELWWHFSLKGDAPRFLRAMVGIMAFVLYATLVRIMRPQIPDPLPPGLEDLEKVEKLIRSSPLTYPNIALLGDKRFIFSPGYKSFIMYGAHGRSWVAIGDPVGESEEMATLAWDFRELVDRHDGLAVFYDVSKDNLNIYLELGLSIVKLGEEARVFLPDFHLEGGEMKKLRSTVNKLEKEGCVFEVAPAAEVPRMLPEMRLISDTWLDKKNTKEKRFTMGYFSEDYLSHFPAAVVKKEGKILAFANIWEGAGKEELSIDLMRYLPEDAPSNVMEYLFIRLMLWGGGQGYRWFNLGMASLSGLEGRTLAPIWNKLGAIVFRYGDHFYNFQGLRQYKEKFDPQWEPKYMAFPGGFSLLNILTDIAFLTAGGLKGIISK